MRLLKSIGISSYGTAFEQLTISSAEKEARFKQLSAEGYTLICKHISKEVFLFHLNNTFIVASISDQKSSPEALGALVEDVELALEVLQTKQLDIFDSGAVGELALHLPAFREKNGRIIYLIGRHRAHDFYASDFQSIGN